MWIESKELQNMFKKIRPYLVLKLNGKVDFIPSASPEIRALYKEYLKRRLAEQIAAGEQ